MASIQSHLPELGSKMLGAGSLVRLVLAATHETRCAARNVIDRAANNREKWRPATARSCPTTR